MPLLLDTCTFLWLCLDQSKLSDVAKQAIKKYQDDLFVPAISALEISALYRKRRVKLPMETEEWFRKALRQHGVQQVPLNFQIASKSDRLPGIHRDPMDRILIATAQEYRMTIVTPDRLICQYPEVECLW